MQDLEDDHYAVLGVEEGAAPDDIRKAYLKLAKKLHPDRFPNDPEKRAAAQTEFSRVTRAHEVLGDARQKEEYDALRALARNRAALDSGIAGAASGVMSGASGTVEARVETKESWAEKHAARAQECFSKKRFQEAETAIKEAIRLVPNKTSYHCKLAEIYTARGWKTLAQTEIETALRMDPNDTDAKNIAMKLKSAKAKPVEKKGLLDQIKELLSKKR